MEIIPIPGGTNVSAGYLKSGSSSGASPPTSGPFGTATVTVAAGAVLDVNGQTVGNAINLSGTGISSNGAIINSSTTAATISADITLAAHSSVGGSNAVTLSGAISGGYNFTKVGSSTYTLSGTNTYTGDTTINTGTLYITNTNALGTTGGSTTIESGAQLTIATDLIVAEDMNISGTGISSAGVINSSGAMTLSGDINVVATASIITTGNLTFSGNIVKTSGSNATLTISTDAQLQFMNASAITATNNALSLELTSDADSLGNEVIKLGANITTNGGSLTVNSDTYLTKYIEINTTGTSDGAVTFSGLVQGYIADENRIILTGSGGYYYYDVTNSTAYNPVSQTYGTATLDGTLASGGSVSLGDGTLGWDGSRYTWTPDHSGDVEYLILGGGASGTRGQWGEYYGGGGGAGAVEEGSLTVTGSTGYNAVVGAGGDKETGVYTNYSSMGDGVDGIDGGDSTFSSVTATGGYASVNDLVADARGGHKAAWGGNSGNGNSGGYGGAFSCGECNAGGGGGSLSAGSGKNGGAGVTSGITGTNVEYGSGGAGLGSGTSYGTSSGGAGSSSRTYALANTGSGGSDATSVHPGYAGNGGSGLVVIAYDNGLTIDSGSAQVTLSGDVTKLSNLDITSSYDGSTISGIVSGLTPITYTGPTAGELIVSADNTFTGNVNVISGALSITHNNALGTTAGTTTVASGAALHLSNNITVAEAITIGGTGISTNGAIRNVADSNTLSGLITLAADAEIQIDTGTTLALNVASGNAITGTFNLTMDSVGTSSIADPIATSTGTLTKTGAGTLTLGGTNTFSGDLTISAGTVTMTGTLADTVDVINSGTYDVDATDTIQSLSGSGAVQIDTGVTLTFGDANDKTISGVISGAGNLTKVGAGTQTLSGTNTYTGDTTISAGTIKLTGNLNSATDLVIASGTTLDLQAALTAATLDLDGTISNTAGTSSLVISGTSSLGGSVTTTSTQTYTGVTTLTGNTTLTTSSAQVTFSNTINSEGSETNNLTITASETEFNGIIGGTRTLGVMDINGTLDLNAAITAATSIDVSGTSNLGANVTTTGTQTYNGATTLSGADRNLTASTVNFGDTITGTTSHDLTITGNLDLDGALTSVVDLSVSGTSNLGDNVTTSGTQTYQDAVTVSSDVTLTTTNSNVDFDSTVNAGTAGDALTIAAGTGDVTFDYAIGGTTAMGNLSITTGALTAPAIKAQGTITVTNSSASSITGVISNGASAAILTKAGSGTLTLSGNNTYTGATTINSGVLSITHNNALGTTAGATTVASGAALHVSNDITVAEAITISGTGVSSVGALYFVSGNNTYSGNITLGAATTITSAAGNQTISGTINGAFTLSLTSAANLSLTGSIGSSTQPTSLTATTTGSSNDLTLGGNIEVNGPITFTSARDIILNTNLVKSYASSEDIILRAKRDITTQTNDTTSLAVTSTGGNILFTSDTDDTNGGGILILGGTVIDSNGGDITFAGGDASGSGYASGRSVASSGWNIEGLRINGTASNPIDIDSDGGNIIMRGKTSNNNGTGTYIADGNGGSGLSFYSGNIDINSGTGTLYLEGKSYTYSPSQAYGYNSGIHIGGLGSNYTFTLTSSNTTSDAIRIIGNHNINQTGGKTYGIQFYQAGTIQALATGGGIRIDSDTTGDPYGLSAVKEINILAKSGPIQLLDTRAGGYLYFGAAPYIGSKSGSAVTSSSSDITIQYDSYSWGSNTPNISTSGAVTVKSYSDSFQNHTDVDTSWFDWNDNSEVMSALTFGKLSNTTTLDINSNLTSSGSITIYGGVVNVSGSLTSSGTGDILIKSNNAVMNSIYFSSGADILKTGGDRSTLTLQSDGQINFNTGSIIDASSTILDVVFWANYGGSATVGGLSLTPDITTNGGHIWMGGSSTSGGSSTWNGLTVGNGPSNGYTGFHSNALNFRGDLDTDGSSTDGDIYIWAGDGYSTAVNGLGIYGTNPTLASGTGSITIIADEIINGSGALPLTISTTGDFTYKPHTTSFENSNTLGSLFSFSSNPANIVIGKSGNSTNVTLAANVITSGTQTYYAPITLSGGTRTLTASTVNFTSTLAGGSNALAITGNLDLDGTATGITTLSVSGTSNLGANVTTSGTQTYTGNATINGNRTLTTTNSNVTFSGTTNAASAGDTLTIAAGSGDVTFTGAVGGTTALGNTTITTGALSAANMTVQGTIDVTNTSASSITGVIADGASAATLTKAGSGTLTLSGTNTYTGLTTINAGTLKATVNNALGTNAAGTVIASGATLDLANVTYSTTEAITNSGALSTSTGTSSYAGTMTLGADATIDVDGTQLTISTAIGDGSGGYAITKEGTGTLVLSATSTYTGDTTISAGTIKLTGNLNSATDLVIASGPP